MAIPTRRLWLVGTPIALLLGVFAWAVLLAWREPALGADAARLAQPGDVRMLSSQTCTYCTAARHWMQTYEVKFDECFVETDSACAAEFKAQRAGGTPLLMVRGQPQLGFSPLRVRDALAAPG